MGPHLWSSEGEGRSVPAGSGGPGLQASRLEASCRHHLKQRDT